MFNHDDVDSIGTTTLKASSRLDGIYQEARNANGYLFRPYIKLPGYKFALLVICDSE